ncbi:MAG TPA: Cof-type HAD-IIB family hydrolase [Lachnospiraceae bacterium]|nr:Cof-type HAD-IIB family hydrolase [Lachnospiraceae bacterium]
MSAKLLFTDLDGTLLSSDKTVSEDNSEAINEMVRLGHKFVIATGRPIVSALKISDRYGWNREGFYISSFNGGLIYDCGGRRAIFREGMTRADVKYILDRAHEAGIHAHTYDEASVISEYDTPEFRRYIKGINMPGIVVKDIAAYLDTDPVKAIVISYEGREKLERFRESISAFSDDRLAYTFSNPFYLEYSNIRASKGESLKYLAGFFNIPLEDTVACGDEENDLSMIEAGGTGVVMANGTAFMKEHADYITEADNDHGAIAEVIKRFII